MNLYQVDEQLVSTILVTVTLAAVFTTILTQAALRGLGFLLGRLIDSDRGLFRKADKGRRSVGVASAELPVTLGATS